MMGLYVMSEEGLAQFPVHKGKRFFLKFHPLTPDFVKARRVDRKTWGVWARRFFRRLHR